MLADPLFAAFLSFTLAVRRHARVGTTAVVVRNTLDGGRRAGMLGRGRRRRRQRDACDGRRAGCGRPACPAGPAAIDVVRVAPGADTWPGSGCADCGRRGARRAAPPLDVPAAAHHGGPPSQPARRADGQHPQSRSSSTFYLAAVPTFLRPSWPRGSPTSSLAACHVTMAFVCHSAWALGFDRVRPRAPATRATSRARPGDVGGDAAARLSCADATCPISVSSPKSCWHSARTASRRAAFPSSNTRSILVAAPGRRAHRDPRCFTRLRRRNTSTGPVCRTRGDGSHARGGRLLPSVTCAAGSAPGAGAAAQGAAQRPADTPRDAAGTGVAATFSGVDRQLAVRPPRLDAEVVVDGALDEPVWREAARADRLLAVRARRRPARGARRTRCSSGMRPRRCTSASARTRAAGRGAGDARQPRPHRRRRHDPHPPEHVQRPPPGVHVRVNPLGVQADGALIEGTRRR